MLLYADDMVMYYSNKNAETINNVLNNEFQKVLNWLRENDLIINLKPGKTETMLFGSQQKLKKADKLSITGDLTPINPVDEYEYLGTIIDKTLSFKSHVHKLHKKAMSRVKLLSRIRKDVSPYIAETIYRSMIQSLLVSTETEVLTSPFMATKYQATQDRAHKIVYGKKATSNKWPKIRELCAEQVACDVYQIAPDVYEDYFTIFNHNVNTRGNHKNIKLPKIKSENGRKMFAFQGALLYNKLPKEIIMEATFNGFKEKVNEFFRN